MEESVLLIECNRTPNPSHGELTIRVQEHWVTLVLNPLHDLCSPERAFDYFWNVLASNFSASELDDDSMGNVVRRMMTMALNFLCREQWQFGLSMAVGVLSLAEYEALRALIIGAQEIYDEITNESSPGEDSPGLSEEEIFLLKKERFCCGYESCNVESCSVCLEGYVEGDVVTPLSPCSHRFHNECVAKWLRNKRTCPMCRSECTV